MHRFATSELFDGVAHAFPGPPALPGLPETNIVVTREGSRAALDAGVFVEQEWLVADKRVALRPGLRVEWLGLAERGVIDPRIARYSHDPRSVLELHRPKNGCCARSEIPGIGFAVRTLAYRPSEV